MALPWTYCECGCHAHVVELTRVEGTTTHVLRTLFSLYEELRDAPSGGWLDGPFHLYRGHGGIVVDTFATREEADARAVALLPSILPAIDNDVAEAQRMLEKVQSRLDSLKAERDMVLALLPATPRA